MIHTSATVFTKSISQNRQNLTETRKMSTHKKRLALFLTLIVVTNNHNSVQVDAKLGLKCVEGRFLGKSLTKSWLESGRKKQYKWEMESRPLMVRFHRRQHHYMQILCEVLLEAWLIIQQFSKQQIHKRKFKEKCINCHWPWEIQCTHPCLSEDSEKHTLASSARRHFHCWGKDKD